ncbi:MAG: efflux RND transporter periplasmic adaptor subunit, partial [Planctomycetota bacterium]
MLRPTALLLSLTLCACGLRGGSDPSVVAQSGPAAVAVEIGRAGRGTLIERRIYSGTLEASAEFMVASKVNGRVEELVVDLGDRVSRGQVVARIEDDEFEQAVAEAQANVSVAEAQAAEAGSALELAKRRLERAQSLTTGGIASEATLDDARAEVTAASARVQVTAAQLERARASMEAARIRLSYTVVAADWAGGDEDRLVSDRRVDQGATVDTNDSLLTIVELDPVIGVVFVPERDFAGIGVGQPVSIAVDAYPDEEFVGRVSKIAPVFANATRQARVELLVQNPDERLRPGMFTRATIELSRIDDALHVPISALIERAGQSGVFELDASRERVRWRPLEPGVIDGSR